MAARQGINHPKFKDEFALIDFDADPLPALSLFPRPCAQRIEDWQLMLHGTHGNRRAITWSDLACLPIVRERAPLVCQIFNWSEAPMVEGVRLASVLDAAGVDAPLGGYFAFYSADGLYFEGLPRAMAWDPRVLLVFELNGEPLRHEHGGPVRLWVPFLQGYKSVKWLHQIRMFARDPVGIKRLLGQSRTAMLGAPGQEKAGIVVARVTHGGSAAEI